MVVLENVKNNIKKEADDAKAKEAETKQAEQKKLESSARKQAMVNSLILGKLPAGE